MEPPGRVYNKEERKAQLRAAVQDIKQTGKAKAAFEESVDIYACGPADSQQCTAVHS